MPSHEALVACDHLAVCCPGNPSSLGGAACPLQPCLQWGDSFQGGERWGLVGYLAQLCLEHLPVSMGQSPKAGGEPPILVNTARA